jgi:hypothetical protein
MVRGFGFESMRCKIVNRCMDPILRASGAQGYSNSDRDSMDHEMLLGDFRSKQLLQQTRIRT